VNCFLLAAAPGSTYLFQDVLSLMFQDVLSALVSIILFKIPDAYCSYEHLGLHNYSFHSLFVVLINFFNLCLIIHLI
jgi:hypothetical protein